MRSAFIFPAVVICVSSVFSQQPFVRYSENLKKVVPNHYKNDKENTYRSLDQIARGHKVEPRQPPLKPEPSIPWFQWLQQGRWAAHADRNTELHKVRARLLEQKLKPNQLAFRPRIDPQQKPNLKPAERNSIKRNTENVEVKKESNVRTRHKRDVAMTQVKPAIHHQETKMSGTEQFGGGESEKRDKRQILYFINSPNRPIQLMPRPPRTTPNPFIRDTHIEEYDIIRPEVGEREGMIPTIETGSSDPGSYPLVSETSDLEYESDYTISMSDSEEWHNYPLTTPSGPNPGWHLSTLADIYQKQRKPQYQVFKPVQTREIMSVVRVWPEKPLIRAKRSPKQPKRRIGAYKEKLKQRRKLKDIRRKRRIIRNSKEDKAVKEDLKDENAIERLLQRPRVFPRQTAYQMEDTSREILWTNGTHNIVEDPDATVKWINETHYVIYREQDNSTNEWYNEHHVLLYNDEWENKTSEEKRKTTIGLEEEETVEVKKEEKTKAGKSTVKKKQVKRKGGKRMADKKAPKPKIKSKKSKKIMTVKNVNEAPKDPRRDPREKKIIKDTSTSEEKVKKKKKRIKSKDEKGSSEENTNLKTSDEKDMSKSKEKKKKRVKSKDKKDSSGSKEKRKKKESKRDSQEGNLSKKKRKKLKTKSDENNSGDKIKKKKRKPKEMDLSSQPRKVKRKKVEKEKKSTESSKLSKEEVQRKKKKKTDPSEENKDKNYRRKKRSIYRSSSESKSGEVRWEKVQKSEYDGWQVFGEEDKSEVYDVSYELIENKNITKKP